MQYSDPGYSSGRRVTVRDLVEAGLLQTGAELRWTRPNLGQDHLAVVDQQGRILLDDGRAYSAPSRAAIEAVGGGSFDGWLAWRVTSSGELLDKVRQNFLDLAVEEATAISSSTDNDAQEFLRRARDSADAGEPIIETVKDLLAHWGLASRDLAAVDRVSADLENHGLATSPNFLKVSLESPTSLVVQAGVDVPDADSGQVSGVAAEDVIEIGITLGNLVEPGSKLTSVTRESSLDEAVTLMLLNDYSQLPVLAGERRLHGAITWQSIAQAAHAKQPPTIAAALVIYPLHNFDDELVDVLDEIQEKDFVIVRDAVDKITGIVTAADVVRKYGELATPFFLVGELDQYLRRIIRDNFPLVQVQELCHAAGHDIDGFDQMTVGDYQTVLGNPACWSRLAWSLDRASFMARFDEMRRLRNDLMHFNRDRVSVADVDKLRLMIAILKTYALT